MKDDYLIRAQYAAEYELGFFPGDLERTDPKSKTVPGMTETLEDLLNKNVTPTLPMMFEGDHQLPDVRRMSKVEKEEFRREVATGIAVLQKQRSDDALAKRKDALAKHKENFEAMKLRINELENSQKDL